MLMETKIIIARFVLILLQIAVCVFLGWVALEILQQPPVDYLTIEKVCHRFGFN